eukprot:3518819-Amphidinium_carterae.1
MMAYCARKVHMLKDLEKAGCDLPSTARGIILLRDAGLNPREQDNIQFWTQGSYELATVQEALRKLDRPMASASSSTAILYDEEQHWDPENAWA